MSSTLTLTVLAAYLGIDVAKDKLDVVLRWGAQQSYRVFPNSPAGFAALHAWLSSLSLSSLHICLESTGSYSDGIAHFLAAQGYHLSLLNPIVLVNYRKTKNIRRKTDRDDARLLALYAQENQPRLWQPLPEAIVHLRRLLCYRTDVLDMLQQEQNRLHAGRLTRWTFEQILWHCLALRRSLKQAEAQLELHIQRHASLAEPYRRLQTIPGIGPITAAALLAFIGDIARFEHVSAVVSLCGLAVKVGQSGTSVHDRPHIDRHGHAHLRQLLYWCAITALRTDPQFQAFAQRLRARGKPNKVIIVAVMRKLIHISYGVWKHQADYNATKVLGPLA